MGVIQAFLHLSPILPDLSWLLVAFIGVLCPVFSLIVMQSIYMKEAKLIRKSAEYKEGVLGWIFTSLLSIAIIWFSVGVFPVYPSVIATGSMEPMIKPGDVILVKKITDIEQVNIGDVIQFKRGKILISHRVIEILEDEERGICYRTKGDNNSAADFELVYPEHLKGRIVYVVPKVGWPTLFIKSRDSEPIENVVF
jgi:signal peptidase